MTNNFNVQSKISHHTFNTMTKETADPRRQAKVRKKQYLTECNVIEDHCCPTCQENYLNSSIADISRGIVQRVLVCKFDRQLILSAAEKSVHKNQTYQFENSKDQKRLAKIEKHFRIFQGATSVGMIKRVAAKCVCVNI